MAYERRPHKGRLRPTGEPGTAPTINRKFLIAPVMRRTNLRLVKTKTRIPRPWRREKRLIIGKKFCYLKRIEELLNGNFLIRLAVFLKINDQFQASLYDSECRRQ